MKKVHTYLQKEKKKVHKAKTQEVAALGHTSHMLLNGFLSIQLNTVKQVTFDSRAGHMPGMQALFPVWGL